MPAALIMMSVTERERYVRWWIEESGLTLAQLREVAGAVWAEHGSEPPDARNEKLSRPQNARRRG
jgi:hypothetical protein